MAGVVRWIRSRLEWWSRNWLRFHTAATPIGSTLVTLWLSQVENVGWWWNSQAELEAAARFASAGILFYTASFAALETGVWLIMVLALRAIESYEARSKRRRQALIALGIEAQRRSAATGKPVEEILKELESENWQPPQA